MIGRAKYERRNIAALEEGVKAELLLPIMQSLRLEEKFRSAQDLRDQIARLETELQRIQGIQERIPIVKQIVEVEHALAREQEKYC